MFSWIDQRFKNTRDPIEKSIGDLRMSFTHSSTKSLVAASYVPFEIILHVREIIFNYHEKQATCYRR